MAGLGLFQLGLKKFLSSISLLGWWYKYFVGPADPLGQCWGVDFLSLHLLGVPQCYPWRRRRRLGEMLGADDFLLENHERTKNAIFIAGFDFPIISIKVDLVYSVCGIMPVCFVKLLAYN